MAKLQLSKASKFLILTSIISTIAIYSAIKKHTDNKSLLETNQKLVLENQKLSKEVEKHNNRLQTLNSKNKKLSKRFINETNKIINLKTSVKNLDKDLKKGKEKLWTKAKTAENLINENKVLESKISKAEALTTSSIHTIVMRKKVNGNFTKTVNPKKVDAFKTVFHILENNFAPSGTKKVTVQLYDKTNNNIISDDVFDVDYNNKASQIVSLIEVNRADINEGTYAIRVFINDKLINSTELNIE